MAQPTIQQAFDLAFQHHQAGRLSEADWLYRQVLSDQPAHADAMHYLGVIAHQVGRNDVAVQLMSRAIELAPDLPEIRTNLGNALGASGRLDEAIICYGEAIRLQPNYAQAHFNLGNALANKGQFDEAIAAYRQAVLMQPAFPEAHTNLGNALRNRGDVDGAIAAHRKAIAYRSNYAQAYNNLGNCLKDLGQAEQAIAAYRQALLLKPDYAEACSNLGVLLNEQGELDEAVSALQRAIVLRNDYAEAYNNLGVALKGKGKLDEALAAFRRAIALNPHRHAAHSSLVYTLAFHPDCTAQAIYEEARRWHNQHARQFVGEIQPWGNAPEPDRPLRIGYVSPNFRQHTNGLAMLPLLDAHDHSRYRSICYSDARRPDSITEQCRNAVDEWRNIVGLSDEQVARLVRQDRIDILVDLVSHMAENRLLVFARKPAPVQVTFLGHQSTTGLTTIDYRLSDSYVDPSGRDDAYYTEKVIRLPDCYLVFRSSPQSPPVNEPPVLETGHITFGSLNNFCKITPKVLDLWSRVLKELPNSKMILRCPAGETQQRVLGFFEQRGIAPTRLSIISKLLSADEYLRLHHRMDVYLDPFPHSGHTTSMDALWMGVPLVTLAGKTAVGGGGVFLLANLGLDELIASNEQEYLSKATTLARDLPRLKELRATLRQRMQHSPLMDAPRYARNIELAYRQMWHDWCKMLSQPS